jgi:hypothetical protein
MRLWEITDYRQALDVELSRLVAIERLGEKYPGGWEKAAPADLVFMLTRGVRMAEALVKVAELTAPEPGQEPAFPRRKAPRRASRKRSTAPARNKTASTAPATASPEVPAAVPAGGPEQPPADLDGESAVLWYLSKGYSASAAGKAAGYTDSYGRQIARKLAKAAPKGPEEG